MEQNTEDKIDIACKNAAEAIKNADILLLATGAGFSADSGLAVYKDIADVPAYHKMNLNYMQLCNPSWLRSKPDIFYGFWGSCFNSYRDTDPHKGYSIVKQWKEKLFADKPCKKQIQEQIKDRSSTQYISKSLTLEEQLSKLNLKSDPLDAYPGAFFVYTSNVDNHSIKCGFNPNEVFEIHGTTENWQCSKTCQSTFWQAPKNFKFQIDLKTMIAEKTENSKSAEVGWKSNYPTCVHCDALARPAVLMFGDSGWVDDPMQTRIYRSWKLAVVDMLEKNKDLKLAILEIGAGTNVPTVRYQSESYCDKLDPKQCTLIRINPDFPNYEGRNSSANVISIQTKGLEALVKIDSYINKL